MPSLDTIRTVTIRGQADGVDQTRAALDRLTASLQSANQNLAQTRQVANDNAAGFSLTGESAVSAANHLRQAAEAAYAFSPAFRGVVNEMAVPALKGAGVALEGVAAGIVTATNVAGTGVIRLGTAIETTFPAFAVLGTSVKTAGAAMEAFSPTLGGAAASIASRLLPALSLLARGLLIVDAVKLLTEAWRLGNERLAEYVALAEKASASGLSTDFYQRITKAAEDAKTPVEALTEAFKKLSQAAGPDLGGTAAQNRLKTLVDAGNFGGNSGVGDLKSANSNEERLRALATLYDQALEKGQRLAALDLVKAFGGDQLAANLAKDSGYLDKLLESADEIAQKELISAGDIQRATELQDRLDAAEKILSQRWHPIQELLADLGVKMKETWISIVEAIANAVDAVFKLGQRIADALAPLLGFIQSAGQLIGKAAPYLATVPGAQGLAVGAASIGVLSTPSSNVDQEAAQREAQMADARKRLAEAMNKKFDTSTPPPAAQEASAYDRAIDSINKYIEVTKASTETVGQSVDAQERAKAIAQLTAAALKDGTTVTAAMRAEMQKLGDAAGEAALALEKAKVASDIKFDRASALLTPADLQIAQQLKGIYGSDIPAALNSSYAAEIRFNNTVRELSSLGQEVNRGFLTEFGQNLRNGQSLMQAFENAGLSALGKIADKLAQMAADQLWSNAFGGSGGSGGLLGLLGLGGGGVAANGSILGAIGPTSVGGAPLVGLHSGGIVGSEATFYRSVSMSAFAGAPRFHTGGIAGDEVPIIAKRGEGVFTPGQMAAMGSGGSQPMNITYSPNIDARGADAAAVARIATVVAQDKKNFERNVTAVMARTRANTPGFLRGYMADIFDYPREWYRFTSIRFQLRGNSQVSPLPWTGGSSVYGPHAQLFMPKLTATEIDDLAVWRAVDAFFSRLGGQAGLLRIGDASRLHPQYNVAATASVQRWSDGSLFSDGTGFSSGLLSPTAHLTAAAARGDNAIQIGGLLPSLKPALMRGDLLELRPNGRPASFPHLYQVMVDGPTDASGATGVELRPRLRADVAAGDMVVLDYPTSVFRLMSDDEAEIEISVPTVANLGFSLVEAVDQVP